MEEVAGNIAVRSRLWSRKGRRIDECAVVVQVRIDAGDQVRTMRVTASLNASGGVDDRRSTGSLRSKHVSSGVDPHDVGPDHQNIDRYAAARISNKRNLPIAEQCAGGASRPFSEWKSIDQAGVKIVANVKIVVAFFVIERRNRSCVIVRRDRFV